MIVDMCKICLANPASQDTNVGDIARTMTIVYSSLAVLFVAVAITTVWRKIMRSKYHEARLTSAQRLVGCKVTVKITCGPDNVGRFVHSDGDEMLEGKSKVWIYPGREARVINYQNNIYWLRPLHEDYKRVQTKE